MWVRGDEPRATFEADWPDADRLASVGVVNWVPVSLELYLQSMPTAVASLLDQILPVLRRYSVLRAGIFGSYARDEATPESDLDLLVELPAGASLLDLVGLQLDLSDALGLEVNATTYRALHPHIRERILQDEVRIL